MFGTHRARGGCRCACAPGIGVDARWRSGTALSTAGTLVSEKVETAGRWMDRPHNCRERVVAFRPFLRLV